MVSIHKHDGVNWAIDNALAAIAQAEHRGYEEWIHAVNEMRRQVVIAIAQGGKLNQATANAIKAEVADIASTYRVKFSGILSQNQKRLFTKGLQVVDKAIAGADLTLAIPYLSEATLSQAQQFGAGLIGNLTDYARGEIAKHIDLAVLGQQSLEETLSGIGANLSDSSIFSAIAKRSEVIYVTEVNRMANLATRDRLKQAHKQVPDLMKSWVHSHIGVPRPGHLLLDGETIPVDKKFKLIGADGHIYMVDGPHDPRLPVGEVVHCKCQLVPVVAREAADENLRAEGTSRSASALSRSPETAGQNPGGLYESEGTRRE